MKRVFITGVSGFVGGTLARQLTTLGHFVVGTDLALPALGHTYKHIQGDLTSMDLEGIFINENPEWIIHCAGNANVGLSVIDPLMDLNSSLILLHKLLYSLKSAKITAKVLFFSSAAVYGNPDKLPIKEESKLNPVSPYGLHKAYCEDLCAYFSRVEGIQCHTLRVFSAYGAGLRKQILWDLFSKATVPGDIKMFGTGAETRDFIHIKDVIQSAVLVLENGAPGIFNIANGSEIRIDQIATIFLSALGVNLERLKFNRITKDGDPLNWQADVRRIKELGYIQKVNLIDGINEYAQWVGTLAN